MRGRDRTPDDEGMETPILPAARVKIELVSRPNARRRGHGNVCSRVLPAGCSAGCRDVAGPAAGKGAGGPRSVAGANRTRKVGRSGQIGSRQGVAEGGN